MYYCGALVITDSVITYWMGSHLVVHSWHFGKIQNQKPRQLPSLETDYSEWQQKVVHALIDLKGKKIV